MIVRVVEGSVTRELRRAVLRPTWAQGTSMHGDGEPQAVHLAVGVGGSVVGACVLIPRPYPRRPGQNGGWQLRGMATAESYRGHGVGSLIVAEAVRQVEIRGGRLLWCEARESAIGFYAGHGFVGEGELFAHEETAIAHLHMYRELFAHPDPSSS